MSLKEKARAFHTAVSDHNVLSVSEMLREDYIQHNPFVPTGRTAFLALLPKLQEHGTKIENIRLFNDGSFVFMHHRWKSAIPFGAENMIAFHVIRFDQAELIAEHWNVITPEAPLNTSNRSLIDGTVTLEDLEKGAGNKNLVYSFIKSLITSSTHLSAEFLKEYLKEDLIQHHPLIGDGLRSYMEAYKNSKTLPQYTKLHKVLSEGNFVLSIAEGKLQEKDIAIYDLYRLKNSLIAEQWCIYQEIPKSNLANNNTMFNF